MCTVVLFNIFIEHFVCLADIYFAPDLADSPSINLHATSSRNVRLSLPVILLLDSNLIHSF